MRNEQVELEFWKGWGQDIFASGGMSFGSNYFLGRRASHVFLETRDRQNSS